MSIIHRFTLILEFLFTLLLVPLALFALSIMGSLILAISPILLIVALVIIGNYAFGNGEPISDYWWHAAWTGIAIVSACTVAVLIDYFGIFDFSGDQFIPIRVMSIGVILVVPFLHCLHLKRKTQQVV